MFVMRDKLCRERIFFTRITGRLANNGEVFWLTPLYLFLLSPWKHGTFSMLEQKEFVFCLSD